MARTHAARSYRQGWFVPRNPEKYRGDVTKIRYMSSWELKCDEFLDNSTSVLEWSSEELVIPYLKPTDGKVHRYFPDYWVKYRNRDGEIIEEVWEIKPSKEVSPPTRRGKRKKQQLYEQLTHAINIAKWKQAQAFCNQRGWKFRILTEKELFK